MGLISGLGLGGCWEYARSHCANLDGDSSCGEGSYCSSCCEPSNNGCTPIHCHCPGSSPSVGDDAGAGDATDMSGSGGGTASTGITSASADGIWSVSVTCSSSLIERASWPEWSSAGAGDLSRSRVWRDRW